MKVVLPFLLWAILETSGFNAASRIPGVNGDDDIRNYPNSRPISGRFYPFSPQDPKTGNVKQRRDDSEEYPEETEVGYEIPERAASSSRAVFPGPYDAWSSDEDLLGDGARLNILSDPGHAESERATAYEAYSQPYSGCQSVDCIYQPNSYCCRNMGSVNGYTGPMNGYTGLMNGYPGSANGYNRPMNGYNRPVNGYPGPVNGYNSPMNGYTSPMNGYPGPGNGYNRPMNGYNRPVNGYNSPINGYTRQYTGPESSVPSYGYQSRHPSQSYGYSSNSYPSSSYGHNPYGHTEFSHKYSNEYNANPPSYDYGYNPRSYNYGPNSYPSAQYSGARAVGDDDQSDGGTAAEDIEAASFEDILKLQDAGFEDGSPDEEREARAMEYIEEDEATGARAIEDYSSDKVAEARAIEDYSSGDGTFERARLIGNSHDPSDGNGGRSYEDDPSYESDEEFLAGRDAQDYSSSSSGVENLKVSREVDDEPYNPSDGAPFLPGSLGPVKPPRKGQLTLLYSKPIENAPPGYFPNRKRH